MDGSCEKCPRGTYRVKTDSHSCVKCSDGKTTRNTGSDLASDCIRKAYFNFFKNFIVLNCFKN